MRQIELRATSWKSADDFYDALFVALGSPDWHGRNMDALWDSIVVGDINEVEPPFTIILLGWPADDRASTVLQRFVDLIHEASAKGVPVSIQTSRMKDS